MKTIQQKIQFAVSPDELFDLYMDSAKHSAATNAPASISREVPGEFTAFGGGLRGRNLLVEPGHRIVQSWRAEGWKGEDPDSVLILAFGGDTNRGCVELTQVGVPDHVYETIRDGWEKYYWKPWRDYLAASGRAG